MANNDISTSRVSTRGVRASNQAQQSVRDAANVSKSVFDSTQADISIANPVATIYKGAQKLSELNAMHRNGIVRDSNGNIVTMTESQANKLVQNLDKVTSELSPNDTHKSIKEETASKNPLQASLANVKALALKNWEYNHGEMDVMPMTNAESLSQALNNYREITSSYNQQIVDANNRGISSSNLQRERQAAINNSLRDIQDRQNRFTAQGAYGKSMEAESYDNEAKSATKQTNEFAASKSARREARQRQSESTAYSSLKQATPTFNAPTKQTGLSK